MAKVTILRTDKGTKILGTMQCSNGAYWDAEGCYKYCNSMDTEFMNQHQTTKLLSIASNLGRDCVDEEQWWKHRENFIDVEIDYDVEQTYQYCFFCKPFLHKIAKRFCR